jgi:hypothetical protein
MDIGLDYVLAIQEIPEKVTYSYPPHTNKLDRVSMEDMLAEKCCLFLPE